jgi:hypothetical protein
LSISKDTERLPAAGRLKGSSICTIANAAFLPLVAETEVTGALIVGSIGVPVSAFYMPIFLVIVELGLTIPAGTCLRRERSRLSRNLFLVPTSFKGGKNVLEV